MKYSDAELARIARKAAEDALEGELELLRKFCSIDCPSLCEEGNAKVTAVLDEALGEIDGIEIEHVFAPGEGNHVLARLRPEHPTGRIILNAHLDTVFKNESVADHPFHIEGDLAYGLGAGDCKGGVVVAVTAVRLAQKLGLLPDKEIVFLFNCDEEFSPTGSGYEFFRRAMPADAVYVFEGTGEDGSICTSRKGNCSLLIDVTGVRAHSGSAYQKGRSAAVELAHRILRLYESNLDDRGIQFNVGRLTNDDPNNVVSGHCTAQVSVRAASRADVETIRQIAARVEAEPPYVPDTTTRIKLVKAGELMMERKAENVALYERVAAAGRAVLGRELPESARSGFGDACWFSSQGCPVVDGLGTWNVRAHNTDEHIHIRSLTERTALFIGVLAGME